MPDTVAFLAAQPVAAEVTMAITEGTEPTEPFIYYRDPDGRPVYSAVPRQTADGRAFIAVRASEDVSIDDASSVTTAGVPSAAETSSEPTEPRRILYYRNPMGLPDTSPVPKKDSMGMDYIAVYEGEDNGGTVVKISPGRLQQTGVRTELAVRQAVVRPVLVPGTVQLDERLVAVVATRADAFVEEIADVTTGDHVSAGQPLVRLYSPEIAVAGAQYVTELDTGIGVARVGGARDRTSVV